MTRPPRPTFRTHTIVRRVYARLHTRGGDGGEGEGTTYGRQSPMVRHVEFERGRDGDARARRAENQRGSEREPRVRDGERMSDRMDQRREVF